ncbi:serine hydrolase [Luteibacter sp. E-22]|uniref:serine hydrolase domain-containing protein n=1 Tax=Luteibacter sp. E-22 TaxID=3404050 RepID=UPI003CF1BBE8
MPRLPLLASLSLLVFCGAADARSTPPIDPAAMDRAYERLGEAFVDAGKTDALSIAVVDHGKVRYYNFGTLVPGKAASPTERTVYEIGSITKVFTSLLLAQAVIQRRAKPDDDLRRYLPGPYPNLVYQGTPIRLVDLADTTSALPDNLPDMGKLAAGVPPDRVPFVATEALARYERTRMFADLATAQLSARPGTMPRHSNLASILLAVAVEKALGASYEVLLDRHIEKPFGMGQGVGHARDESLAVGYDAEHRALPPLDAPYVASAGGLRYSTQDMARFILAELNGADPVVALSQRVAWGDPEGDAVAYNWKVDKTIDGKRRLRASGGTFGFSSYVEIYPDAAYGVILLANRPGSTQSELQALAEQARLDMLGKPPAQTALENALAKSDFHDFAGAVASVRQKHPELHLSEGKVNDWAYSLLKAKKTAQAIGVFRYNVDRWPKSWNAWDSLAEGYETTGDSPKAIENYQRSLALNPANAHALEQLKVLKGAKP